MDIAKLLARAHKLELKKINAQIQNFYNQISCHLVKRIQSLVVTFYSQQNYDEV